MHAPTHIREALQDFLSSDVAAHEFKVEHDGEERTVVWLLGQLWHCTDVLPGGYCEQLDLPHGSTYAQAVRLMKDKPDPYYR